MKFSNLKVGQVVKNYKELCTLLEIEEKEGRGKLFQMKKIQENITLKKLKKRGHSMKVTDIHILNRDLAENKTYSECIEDLIVDILYFRDVYRKPLFLSKNEFLKSLKMINRNFPIALYNKELLEGRVSGSQTQIQDFLTLSDKKLKDDLKKALKSLSDQRTLSYNEIVIVCEISKSSSTTAKDNVKVIEVGTSNIVHRKANYDELYGIVEAENEVLDKWGYKKIQQVYITKRTKEFRDAVMSKVQSEKNLLSYYYAYEILPIKEALDRLKEKEGNYTDKNRNMLESKINKSVIEMSIANGKKRIKVAENKFELDRSAEDWGRLEDNYIDVVKELSELLLDVNEDIEVIK